MGIGEQNQAARTERNELGKKNNKQLHELPVGGGGGARWKEGVRWKEGGGTTTIKKDERKEKVSLPL